MAAETVTDPFQELGFDFTGLDSTTEAGVYALRFAQAAYNSRPAYDILPGHDADPTLDEILAAHSGTALSIGEVVTGGIEAERSKSLVNFHQWLRTTVDIIGVDTPDSFSEAVSLAQGAAYGYALDQHPDAPGLRSDLHAVTEGFADALLAEPDIHLARLRS